MVCFVHQDDLYLDPGIDYMKWTRAISSVKSIKLQPHDVSVSGVVKLKYVWIEERDKTLNEPKKPNRECPSHTIEPGVCS
jgi:hypothetical protein